MLFRLSVQRQLARTLSARMTLAPTRLQSSMSTPPSSIPSQKKSSPIDPPKSKPPRKHRRNIKLVDISKQINASVTDSLITESTDILDEGLTYLREIQVAEAIPESDLQFAFKKLATDILKRALENDISMANQVLDSLVTHRVAHKYHFTLMASHVLRTSSDYTRVLQLWLQYLEYSHGGKMPNTAYTSDVYQPFFLDNLVYYCYIQSCLAENTAPTFADATKLLQRDQLPNTKWVQQTLDQCLLTKAHAAELRNFAVAANSLLYENFDPNGRALVSRVEAAQRRKDHVQLKTLFSEMMSAAKKTGAAVEEKTAVAFMRAFIFSDRPEEVFAIFEMLHSNGMVPSVASWHELFMALAHPRNARDARLTEQLDATVETMLAQGTEMTPKVLAAVVSCYANRGMFEDMDRVIERFSNVLLTATAKNNILVGYLLQGKVKEAEAKLQEYLAEGVLPNTTTMNNFLNAYTKSNNYAAVEGILKFMQEKGIAEDVATLTIVVDVFFKMHIAKGLLPDVEQILAVLTKTKSVVLNDATYTALVNGLGKTGTNIGAARTVFAAGAKKYRQSQHLHTAMLQIELERGLLPIAEALFEKYIGELANTARVWNMMISALLRTNEDLALQYYERMKRELATAAEPNAFTYYFLLSHFVKKGNREKIQYMIDEMADKTAPELGDQVPRLLAGLQEYNMSPKLRASL